MDLPFPRPDLVAGNRRYWMRRTVRCWRALQAGLPAPEPQADDEVMLTARQVRDLFGGVSHMWLERRMDPEHHRKLAIQYRKSKNQQQAA